MNSTTNTVLQNALNSITDKGIFVIVTSKKQKPLIKAYYEFSMTLEFITKKGVQTVYTETVEINTSTYDYSDDVSWNTVGVKFWTHIFHLIESGELRRIYG